VLALTEPTPFLHLCQESSRISAVERWQVAFSWFTPSLGTTTFVFSGQAGKRYDDKHF